MFRAVIAITILMFLGNSAATETPGSQFASSQKEPLFLRVRLTESTYTSYHPFTDASPEDIIMHTWHIQSADVLEVISGQLDSDTVQFAELRHSQRIAPADYDSYVILHAFTNQETEILGTPYFAEGMDNPERIMCFSEDAAMSVIENFEAGPFRVDGSFCYFEGDLLDEDDW